MDTKQVSAALVRAQKAFGPALKSSTNPHFKSKYADLAACIEAVIDALNANGIALLQRNLPAETGICVETVFVHESGESISSGPLHVPAAKNDPQGYGSALTYARRYSLMAACGIAPEDDDGNAGSKKASPNGPISATQEVFKSLPPDWQAWLKDVAPTLENCFDQQGEARAREMLDDLIRKNQLDNEHVAGLFSLLGSKTRSALKSKL
jgi:ERF superfamily